MRVEWNAAGKPKIASKSQTKTCTKTILLNGSNNKTHVIKRFNASFMDKVVRGVG